MLSIAVKSYKEKNGFYPRELFIHGKASFTDDEWNTLLDAIAESKETNLVGVTIKENDGLTLDELVILLINSSKEYGLSDLNIMDLIAGIKK